MNDALAAAVPLILFCAGLAVARWHGRRRLVRDFIAAHRDVRKVQRERGPYWGRIEATETHSYFYVGSGWWLERPRVPSEAEMVLEQIEQNNASLRNILRMLRESNRRHC